MPLKNLSATQFEAFELCNRKWYAKWILGAKEPQSDHLFYGTGLHAIAERFISSDSSGRDASGSAVELFPEGWDTAQQDGHVAYIYSQEEKDLIRKQIAYAIENGVLSKIPGAKAEVPVSLSIDGIPVTGLVDVYSEDTLEIHDHKTAKNRKYAKSERALKSNTQLLLYAKFLIDAVRSKGGNVPHVTLRHNVFLKDGGMPFSTSARASVEDIEREWDRLKDVARKMVAAAELPFEKVPYPLDSSACRAYGGCPLVPVCFQKMGIEDYKANVHERDMNRRALLEARKEGRIMGVFDRIKKNVPAKAPETLPPITRTAIREEAEKQAAVAVEAQAPSAPAENYAETGNAPPWYLEGCVACSDNAVPGFNSSGAPCRVCDAQNLKAGRPVSSTFGVNTKAFTMVARTGAAPEARTAAVQVVEEPVLPAAPVEMEAPPRRPRGRPPGSKNKSKETNDTSLLVSQTVDHSELPVTARACAEESRELPEEDPLTRVVVASHKAPEIQPQSPSTFSMLIGCAPVGEHAGFLNGDVLVGSLQELFCKEKGIANFWEFDPFKRRDGLCLAARKMAHDGHLNGRTLVFPGRMSVDSQGVVEVLRQHATTVIVGTQG